MKFGKLKKDFLRNFEKQNDIDGNLIWESLQTDLKKEIGNDDLSMMMDSFNRKIG